MALSACTSGAADAVNIGFRHFRQLEVDDVRDAINVDTASGNIRCDQHAGLGFAEGIECYFALALALIAMDRNSGNTGCFEVAGNTIGTAFGAGKYERAAHGRISKQVGEKRALLVDLDVNDTLRYALCGRCDGRHLYSDGLVQQFACKIGDLMRHRRGEEQVLPACAELGNNATDRPNEAEIKHLIGLVENQRFDTFQCNCASFHMVEKTTWRCHKHVDALRHRLDLRLVRDTTEYDGDIRPKVAAIGAETFTDLRGEFAGGRQHKNARAPPWRRAPVVGNAGQQGQRECGCLAGARLGNTKQVGAFQQHRYGLCLNWSRRLVAFFGKRLQHGLSKAQFREFRQLRSLSFRDRLGTCRRTAPAHAASELELGGRPACPGRSLWIDRVAQLESAIYR